MKNLFDEVINEDLTYNQGMQGNMDWTSRTLPSQVNLDDILQGNKSGKNANTQGSKLLPSEIANIDAILTKGIEDLNFEMNMFKTTLNNPVIKCSKFRKHMVLKVIKKYETMLKLYVSMFDDLKKLSLD